MTLEMPSEETCLCYDRQTGQIVGVARSVLEALERGVGEKTLERPDWDSEEVDLARAIAQDDESRFVDAPDKFDFHEYHQMERFIGTISDEHAAAQLWRAIKGKGAFRYFKDTIHRLGLQDEWYRYRDRAMKEFVIEWAEAKHVPYVDDSPQPPS